MGDDVVESTSIATPSESNGTHTTKKTPPSTMSNQLRDELIRILKTGDDKNDGAFTVIIATQVEKFVVAAREILMTEQLAQNDISSLLMMRRRHLGSPYANIVDYGGVSDGLMSSVYANPLVNNENFGVQATRQLVDALGKVGDSPAKLVEALALARTHNLPDVAAVLEKKLGVSKAEPASEGGPFDGSTVPTLPDGRPLQ